MYQAEYAVRYNQIEIVALANNFNCVRLCSSCLRGKSKGLRGIGYGMAKAKKAERVESETLTLRLPAPLLELIRSRADSENRSLSNLIVTYLEMVVGESPHDIRKKLSGNGRRSRESKKKKR